MNPITKFLDWLTVRLLARRDKQWERASQKEMEEILASMQ